MSLLGRVRGAHLCITTLLRASVIRVHFGERVSYEIFFSGSCEPSARLCSAPTSVGPACLSRGRNRVNAFFFFAEMWGARGWFPRAAFHRYGHV